MAENQFLNLKKAAIRFSVFGLIFVVVASLVAGCMSTRIRAGEGAVKYSVFGGTDVDAEFGEA